MTHFLRGYQTECLERVKNAFKTSHRALAVLACGAGKTVIFTRLHTVAARPIRVLYLVHKIPLVRQILDQLHAQGRSAGSYCGSLNSWDVTSTDIVATIQSISKLDKPPAFDAVVVDETHCATDIYYKVISRIEKQNHNLKVLGVTATPFTSSGYIYGKKDSYWPEPCFTKGIIDLTNEGHLVRAHLKGGTHMADTKGMRILGGDYQTDDLERDAFSGKIPLQVEEALKLAADRKKIVWACISIRHATEVQRVLQEMGEAAAICTSADAFDEREAQMSSFTEGDARHLVFVNIVSAGWDYPPTDCIVLLRATRSAVMYIQSLGRILRASPGKVDALVIDYGRVVETLGPLHAPRVTKQDHAKAKKIETMTERVVHCEVCLSFDFPPPGKLRPCPVCGSEHEMIRMQKAVERQSRRASTKGDLYETPVGESINWITIKSYRYEVSPKDVTFEFTLDDSSPVPAYIHKIKTPAILSKYDMGPVRAAKKFLSDWFGIKESSLEKMIADLPNATRRPDLVGLSSETLQFRSFSIRSQGDML